MSKQRSQRRTERERIRRRAQAEQERRTATTAKRRQRSRAWRSRLPQRTRVRRQQGVLARRRKMQNLGIAVLFVLSQVLVWILTPDWWLRLAALIVAVLAVPVLTTIVFDRRT